MSDRPDDRAGVTYTVRVEHGRRREDAVTPEHGPVTPPYVQHPSGVSHVKVHVDPTGKTDKQMDQEALTTAYQIAHSTGGGSHPHNRHDMVTKTEIIHLEAGVTFPGKHDEQLHLHPDLGHGMDEWGLYKGSPQLPLYRGVQLPHPSGMDDVRDHLGQSHEQDQAIAHHFVNHAVSGHHDRGHNTTLGIHWSHDRDATEDLANTAHTSDWGGHGDSGHPVMLEADHPGHEHVLNFEDKDHQDARPVSDTVGTHDVHQFMLPEVPVRPGAPMHLRAIHVQKHDGTYHRIPVGLHTQAHYDDPNWRPHDRLFGPTKGQEDPRLFSADHVMLPQVRRHLLAKMDAFMAKHGGPDWTSWARMYLAGSEASDWYGNNDFDILVGVDYDAFRKATDSRLPDEEITDAFNRAFRADWNDEQWRPPFDDDVWHLTGYVNPNSYDIRKIKPYAAYDVENGVWAVKPVQVPDDWGPDKFPDSTWRLAEHYADQIDRIADLGEGPIQKQYATQLFDLIHTDRSRAFGPHGTGVFDVGNVAEKYLDQRPDHPLAMLVEMKNQPLHKTAKLPKTETCSEKGCKEQATVRVLWAEGMGYQPACEAHIDAVKKRLGDDEVCGVKPIKSSAHLMSDDEFDDAWAPEQGSMKGYRPPGKRQQTDEAFRIKRHLEDLAEDEHEMHDGNGEMRHARENGYQRTNYVDFGRTASGSYPDWLPGPPKHVPDDRIGCYKCRSTGLSLGPNYQGHDYPAKGETCPECKGVGHHESAAGDWNPLYIPESQSRQEGEDTSAFHRRTLDIAKARTPGTHVFRGEMRSRDEDHAKPDSIGIHWSVRSEMATSLHRRPDETHTPVLYHAEIHHEDQAIPRSHESWFGRHRSLDPEAEVRFKPGAKVHVHGAYVWHGEGHPRTSAYPTNPGKSAKGWKYHPIGKTVSIEHKRRGDDDLMNYPSLPRASAAIKLRCSGCGEDYFTDGEKHGCEGPEGKMHDHWTEAKTAAAEDYTYRHIVHQPKYGDHRYGDSVEPQGPEQVYNAPGRGAHYGSHVFEHQFLHKGTPVAKLRYSVGAHDPNTIQIMGLAVHPDHQKTGLAVRMADKMQEHAKAHGMQIDHGNYTDQGHAFSRKYMASEHYDPSLHLPYPEKPSATTGEEFLPHMLDPHEMQHGRTASAGGWVQYYANLPDGWEIEHDHLRNLRIGGTTHNSQGRVLPRQHTAATQEEQEHRLSSLWFPEHQSTRFKPVQGLIHGARAYAAMKGLPDPHDQDFHKVVTTPDAIRQVGRAYDSLPHHDPTAEHSFHAMRDEVNHQYDHLTKRMGVKVESTHEDPYSDVHEMAHDIEHNKRLKVLSTKTTGGHPLFTDEENDKFRAVHDAFGHAATGRGFDRHGEEAAYQAHAKMFTHQARGALTSETRGQNASLNLNGHFGPQKIALMPSHFGRTASIYLQGTKKVWRAVPKHVTDLRPGDFVANDPGYAEMHREGMEEQTGQPWHVIEHEVPEHHLEWAGDKDEWHADTGEKREFFYRPEGKTRTVPGPNGEKPDGIMIAIAPPKRVVKNLPIPENGEHPDNIHITVAYLGKIADHSDGQMAHLPELIEAWAETQPKLDARVQGLGTFVNEGSHVLWAAVDMPGVNKMHVDLVEYLDQHGFEVKQDHSFTPHLTLKYHDQPFRFMPRIEPDEFRVRDIWCCVGDRWQSYPLRG